MPNSIGSRNHPFSIVSILAQHFIHVFFWLNPLSLHFDQSKLRNLWRDVTMMSSYCNHNPESIRINPSLSFSSFFFIIFSNSTSHKLKPIARKLWGLELVFGAEDHLYVHFPFSLSYRKNFFIQSKLFHDLIIEMECWSDS